MATLIANLNSTLAILTALIIVATPILFLGYKIAKGIANLGR